MSSRRATVFPTILWIAVLITAALTWFHYGSSTVTKLLAFIPVLASLAPFLPVWPWKWAEPGETTTAEQATKAAQELAAAIQIQWEDEAKRRHIEDAEQMPVEWTTDPAGHPELHRRLELPERGTLELLITKLASSPGRMVVIGEAGSGKSSFCVTLTTALLRNPGNTWIPLMLQMSSWDPDRGLLPWIEHRILRDYPFLANPARYGTTVVERLLADKRLLLILDGLDEIPERARVEALRTISGRQLFIATCREAEFQAIRVAGPPRRCAVVKLVPIPGEKIAEYLIDRLRPNDLGAWEPVLDRLGSAQSDDALVETLSNPLMLYLGTVAYDRPNGQPQELLAVRDEHDAAELNERLLDGYVKSVFLESKNRYFRNDDDPPPEWDPSDAERYLTVLAKHLRRLGTTDLAWWQLRLRVPSWYPILVGIGIGGTACCLLTGLVLGLFGHLQLGLLFGAIVGSVSGAVLESIPPEDPRRMALKGLAKQNLPAYELVRDLRYAIIGATVGCVVVGVIFGMGPGIVVGIFFGVVFAVSKRLSTPIEPKQAVSPIGVLRSDRVAVLYSAGLGGVSGVLVGGGLSMFGDVASHGFVLDAEDHRLVVLLGAVVGLLLGAGGLGMVAQTTSSSGRLISTMVWLWGTRALPFRIMLFLDDAHRLGILRQVGPHYQFRHSLVQDHLADRS